VLTDDGAEDLPALPHDIEALRQAIRQVGAKLVIIDPLSAYLGGDIDPWKDSSVRRALTPLAALAEDTGAAIVAVRHWVKAAATPALYKGQGSIALAAAARQVLCVAPHPDDPETMVLAGVKANLSRQPASLIYRVEETTYAYPDGSSGHVPRVRWLGEVDIAADDLAMAAPGDRELSPERAAIVAYVKGAGRAVGIKDVAEALSIKESTARWHLAEAVKAGQLARAATGLYAAPTTPTPNNTNTTNHIESVCINPVGAVGVVDVGVHQPPCCVTCGEPLPDGWQRRCPACVKAACDQQGITYPPKLRRWLEGER
jgi:hypothetical protein